MIFCKYGISLPSILVNKSHLHFGVAIVEPFEEESDSVEDFLEPPPLFKILPVFVDRSHRHLEAFQVTAKQQQHFKSESMALGVKTL